MNHITIGWKFHNTARTIQLDDQNRIPDRLFDELEKELHVRGCQCDSFYAHKDGEPWVMGDVQLGKYIEFQPLFRK